MLQPDFSVQQVLRNSIINGRGVPGLAVAHVHPILMCWRAGQVLLPAHGLNLALTARARALAPPLSGTARPARTRRHDGIKDCTRIIRHHAPGRAYFGPELPAMLRWRFEPLRAALLLARLRPSEQGRHLRVGWLHRSVSSTHGRRTCRLHQQWSNVIRRVFVDSKSRG